MSYFRYLKVKSNLDRVSEEFPNPVSVHVCEGVIYVWKYDRKAFLYRYQWNMV